MDTRIYIADQRPEVHIANGWVRSTLNFENFQEKHRHPIGKLIHVNELEIDSSQTILIPVQSGTIQILIPLIEAIHVINDEYDFSVQLGEIAIFPVRSDGKMTIKDLENNDENSLIQQFVIQDKHQMTNGLEILRLPILELKDKNKILPICSNYGKNLPLYIGAFYSKMEYSLNLLENNKIGFIFILDGCFEVNERLLFAGDALALNGINSMLAECLSATGLIFFIEL